MAAGGKVAAAQASYSSLIARGWHVHTEELLWCSVVISHTSFGHDKDNDDDDDSFIHVVVGIDLILTRASR